MHIYISSLNGGSLVTRCLQPLRLTAMLKPFTGIPFVLIKYIPMTLLPSQQGFLQCFQCFGVYVQLLHFPVGF